MMQQQHAAGISKRLAEHVFTSNYERLPQTTVLSTKRALLDGVGVMLAASGLSTDAEPFLSLAASSGGDQATILGTGVRVSSEAAAFANGALAHALDFEDSFDLAPVHPNASLIPAALAAAESEARVSGSDLITAVAIGCDLVCRLGLSLRRPMEDGGWYPPPILGAFGAATAAGKIKQLSSRQLLDAFSLMLCQVSCPGEIKYSSETVIRAVREAFPAKAAMTAVELARLGVRGFDQPLEGKAGFFRLFVDGQYDPEAILDGLGEHYWIDQLSFKPWPACRGTHAFIEAAQRLSREHQFDWHDLETISLEGGEVQEMLFFPETQKKAPATAIDAKFSLPFTVAMTLVKGNVGTDSFSDEERNDPDVLALAGRVSYSRRSDWGRERATSGAVELGLAGGSRIRCEIPSALGSPARPLGEDQLRSKFIECAQSARRPMTSAQAADIADRFLSLERECDIASLIAECVGC